MNFENFLKDFNEIVALYHFSAEQEEALIHYGEAMRKNKALIDRANDYYYRIFMAERPPKDADKWDENDGVDYGMLFAALFLARVHTLKEVFRQKNIPARYAEQGILFYKNLFERNFKCYGKFGFSGLYRNGMIGYLFPNNFKIGRLNFEMTDFSAPYAVYQNTKTKEIVPLAVGGLRYTENGKQAPKDSNTVFLTTSLDEADSIEGYTFKKDGKLDFNVRTLPKEEYEKVLDSGDPVLSVHISGNDKLTPRAVEESFDRAKQFFKQYYPDYKFKAFVCSSWLLNTELSGFLKENSNILQFQKNFRIALSFVNTFSIYLHIFETEKEVPLDTLVSKNDFQQKILDYVKNGGLLYSGNGFILI